MKNTIIGAIIGWAFVAVGFYLGGVDLVRGPSLAFAYIVTCAGSICGAVTAHIIETLP